MKWTEEELNIYDYWSGKEGDRIAQIITAENKGKAEGLAEGLKKGKKEQAVEIALNLLDILDTKTIAAKTGLTVSEIENLRQSAYKN
jgi:predicted transposase YdaD